MKARPGPPARADGVWALVPFKAAGAKRRLTALLSADERQGLARAMLRDVLAALSACPDLDGVLLVSRDADAPALAAEFGAKAFADSAADLSGAVTEAGAFAARRLRAGTTLFVPGDVPLIRPPDVAAVLRGHQRVTLVPDRDDVGTNAAASSPPNAFEYLFDGKSFKPHLAAAERAGITARVVRRQAFGLDVDTAAELAAVAATRRRTRTVEFLAARRITARLPPAAAGHAEGRASTPTPLDVP